MLIAADENEHLDEWKEAIKFAIQEQTLLKEASESQDKMPTSDIQEVEKMLRAVEIK